MKDPLTATTDLRPDPLASSGKGLHEHSRVGSLSRNPISRGAGEHQNQRKGFPGGKIDAG